MKNRVNRGKNSPYLIKKHENGPFYLALEGKTPLISPEPSPILQDKGKNYPYLYNFKTNVEVGDILIKRYNGK
jgi:hypothetical protein